jgi:RimJ/RimL family protein N-acetyltransferase
MSWFETANTTLANEHVLLRPVTAADQDALCAVSLDAGIWRYFVVRIDTPDDFAAFFAAGLTDLAAKRRIPYLVIDRNTDSVAGSMSFGNLAENDGRLEIGWSWLGVDFQGKGINRWAKFLLLEHAFERIGAERVEFKTDQLNTQARAGLRNIGATEEGVLRSFNPMPDGRRRDAVFYSVLRAEWPRVREQLLAGPKVAAPVSG